ncbi:hypothetical protein LV84_03699 [Algoriphagus ratkowskyi]|uniref:Uncharacterized protein n=1 Tax=Algoriphagus ratkowskyi TaxID=57028 RepID=A0A2W7SLH4_9BACT|nr:hypothetical protein LV84_03699 [Algoriphagus ratkowskyi]
MYKYDVFVLGSGMAGMNIANICASKGLKVGITDELPYGGDLCTTRLRSQKNNACSYRSKGFCTTPT